MRRGVSLASRIIDPVRRPATVLLQTLAPAAHRSAHLEWPNQPMRVLAQETPVEVLRRMHTRSTGLTRKEAEERLLRFGPNKIQTHPERSMLNALFRQVFNPLSLTLLSTALVSFVLGEAVNAGIILVMVFLSVTLNFTQEYRASSAAKKLQSHLRMTAFVRRSGRLQELPVAELVPGDIVELHAGDLIPADTRLLESKDLFVNQSVLSGESFPAEKHASALPTPNQVLTEYQHALFAGTSVISGTGLAVVVATGKQTQFGAIARSVAREETENDFVRGVRELSTTVVRIIAVFVAGIFALSIWTGQDWYLAILFAVSVAVGLTPEFLPMVLAVTMSRGSLNMAKNGVIVKRLTAIPTLGGMTILCTDKTGTLTEDHIQLIRCIDYRGRDSAEVLHHAYLNSAYQTGISNPMDTAILEHGKSSLTGFRKVDEIPFDFERRRMSVVVAQGAHHVLITKGAPEAILEQVRCVQTEDASKPLTPALLKQLVAQYHQLSAGGFRVLAVASRVFTKEERKSAYTKSDEHGLLFLGFAAFLDPARKGVRRSIDELQNLGIVVKVITGDNELVSTKICENADIPVTGLLLGHEVDALSDSALYGKAMKASLFARCSPLQKERIICVLRQKNQVVGYLGDGINDAPSLRAADVGISVSNAVSVAKESSDLILTTKDLRELRHAVLEGRKTFVNTMKYIRMGHSSNFGNMFSVLGAVLFLPFLPMLPVQILLNNFLYDLSQLALPLDHVDPEELQTPKRWDVREIARFMVVFGSISSVFDFATFAVLYGLFHHQPAAFQTGWFMESLATQAIVIFSIRTAKLSFLHSTPSRLLVISVLLSVGLGWVIPYLPVGRFFSFQPLPSEVFILLVSIVGLYFSTVESAKRFYYSKKS